MHKHGVTDVSGLILRDRDSADVKRVKGNYFYQGVMLLLPLAYLSVSNITEELVMNFDKIFREVRNDQLIILKRWKVLILKI